MIASTAPTLVDRAAVLAADFATRAAAHDRDASFPFENFAALQEAGLLSLTIPVEYGGLGEGLVTTCKLIETIARGDASTALVLAMHYIYHAIFARGRRWPPGMQERLCRESVEGIALVNVMRVEPELGTPSRGGLPATAATRTADGWRLNGHKIYATGSPIVKYNFVWGRTAGGPRGGAPAEGGWGSDNSLSDRTGGPGGGAPAEGGWGSDNSLSDRTGGPGGGAPAEGGWGSDNSPKSEEEPQVGFFLVPSDLPGVRIEETWDHMGMRATGSHDLIMEDVALPEEYALELRAPSAWGPDPATAGWNTLTLCALYHGIATAARDWLLGYLHERKPANLGASLATLPRFQEAVGQIQALLYSSEQLIYGLAAEIDAGNLAAAGRAGLVKYIATNNAIRSVDIALGLIGNPGVSRHNPLERHHRDVLCSRIHSPQDDMILTAAGKAALQV